MPYSTIESPAPSPAAAVVGRVVRLHFACRAEVPIGSFLRVTGSSLWAPGSTATSLTSADSNVDAGEVIQAHRAAGIVQTGCGSGFGMLHEEAYASSVEMVTSPESYPLWRTRKPVVIVLNPHEHSHHHAEGAANKFHSHRYRYLVVTPGAANYLPTSVQGLDAAMAAASMTAKPHPSSSVYRRPSAVLVKHTNEEAETNTNVLARSYADQGSSVVGGGSVLHKHARTDSTSSTDFAGVPLVRENSINSSTAPSTHYAGATSSDTGEGAIPITVWEDPFAVEAGAGAGELTRSIHGGYGTRVPHYKAYASTLSLQNMSAQNVMTVKNLVNLPFRTLLVPFPSAEHDGKSAAGGATDVMVTEDVRGEPGGEYTPDGVRIDTWNSAEDIAWKSYIEISQTVSVFVRAVFFHSFIHSFIHSLRHDFPHTKHDIPYHSFLPSPSVLPYFLDQTPQGTTTCTSSLL